ncbi:hypothetical protein PHYPSEUDO_010103 [Phytophthora pseudosyringae]|uniref:Uncharacterized protein n=1 Tax=Phytophthora pseudosyringae TaxID=221518 RepID=A0A8T1VE15_9STRA|nr:hypothetical protein PHYPSEUDO_010103 [Phytophthora pseudosyringae]
MFERLRGIQDRFPNLTVDLTLLESDDDLQVNRGGLSSLGFRWTDVSTIIRAQNCSDQGATSSCETLYVDDYRYETGLMVSDIVQWYRVVATLRIIGQSYFFLRGIGLMLSCYYIYNTPKTRKGMQKMWTHVRKASHLFMKVPTQCVVYGSPFPVACYVLAHLLDAPFTYQVLESHYLSKDGVISIDLESFISYTVVQMRNVWVYSLAWHLVVRMSTTRCMGSDHRPTRGIIGVPEFLLSGFSSITLSAQYRSTYFRSTKILKVMVLPDNVGSSWEMIKYRYGFGYRGRGNAFLGGVIIDMKFLICLLFTVVALRAVRLSWLYYRTRKYGDDRHKHAQWFVLSPTPVPYSAGVLWPTVSMCVHWTSDFFCIQDRNQPSRTCRRSQVTLSRKLQVHIRKYTDTSPSVRMNVNTFRYIQHQMKCLHGRSDKVDANVAFMNAVLMSDPLVYCHLVLGRPELAYYQSLLRPTQFLLLPVAVVGEHNEYSHGLQLIRHVSTGELSWPELVQCG